MTDPVKNAEIQLLEQAWDRIEAALDHLRDLHMTRFGGMEIEPIKGVPSDEVLAGFSALSVLEDTMGILSNKFSSQEEFRDLVIKMLDRMDEVAEERSS